MQKLDTCISAPDKSNKSNKSFTLQNKGLHLSTIWLSDLSKNKYTAYYRIPIRVLREVEGVRDRLAGEGVEADNTWVPRGMSEVELA